MSPRNAIRAVFQPSALVTKCSCRFPGGYVKCCFPRISRCALGLACWRATPAMRRNTSQSDVCCVVSVACLSPPARNTHGLAPLLAYRGVQCFLLRAGRCRSMCVEFMFRSEIVRDRPNQDPACKFTGMFARWPLASCHVCEHLCLDSCQSVVHTCVGFRCV